MNNTKEKQITANEIVETLKELLQKNIVGVVQKERKNKFEFYFPGGKVFRIFVEEK